MIACGSCGASNIDSARFCAQKAAVDDRWNAAKRRPLFHFGRELPGEPAANSRAGLVPRNLRGCASGWFPETCASIRWGT